MYEKGQYDLENRLIDFAVRVLKVADSLPDTKSGNHIRGQLIRCGTSPSANYGEAQGAESRQDFIHKAKVILKELREVRVWLLLIDRAAMIAPASRLAPLIRETNELTAIFVTSISTASKNDKATIARHE